MSKLVGKVKWFNSAKGYGFINSESHPKDIFLHYSSIEMEGYKTLEEGTEVEFTLEDGPKGPTALDVKKVEN